MSRFQQCRTILIFFNNIKGLAHILYYSFLYALAPPTIFNNKDYPLPPLLAYDVVFKQQCCIYATVYIVMLEGSFFEVLWQSMYGNVAPTQGD